MNSLVNIMIVTTRKCNLNCSHCYNKSGPFKKDVLGENDIEAIIKDICTLQQEYTIERVTVTGGEFLILPNSLWILSRIKSVLKVKTRVETNGIIFLSHPEIIIKYPIDELFVSTDYFHNTLKKDGTSEVLDNLLRIRNNQKIIVRVTLSKGDDTTKSLFLSHYRDIQDLDIEFKYVSPSGRAYENIKEFSGYTLKENPSLFKCKAGDSFLVDLSKKWYACYTNCDLSMVCEVGDAYLLEKMKSVRTDRMNHILSTGQIDFNISDRNNYFYSKKFYYRCEPCLFAQQLNSKKLIVVNLPAVDPTQDAYIKGFIFPTFSEKYLVPMLQNAGLKTEFLDLNLGDIKEQIQKINNTDSLVYIHLTANKYYSYNLFRQLVSTRRIILGGPMPRFCRELFTDEIILDDELEENGICRLFNIENGNLLWERDTFQPACIQPNVDNESVINDFGNVILAGRGCIYQCAFCIHSVFHRKIHMRSVVSLKAELDSYKGVKTSIYLADASVGNSKEYKKIMELLSQYNNLSFSMNIRADQISDEFISQIKRVNIDKLYVGLESLNNNSLCKYQKGENIEKIEEALAKLNKCHIQFHLSYIIDETFEESEFKKFIQKYNPASISAHFYIPYPGTSGYMPDNKWFEKKDWPFTISRYMENDEEIKVNIARFWGYPINKYHTITSHEHTNTFEIINKKLNEMEGLLIR